MRQSQEDLMWQEAAARQEKQEAKYREEIAALTKRAEAAEAKLAEVDAYGVEQWNRGLAEGDFGDCQTFDVWLAARQSARA